MREYGTALDAFLGRISCVFNVGRLCMLGSSVCFDTKSSNVQPRFRYTCGIRLVVRRLDTYMYSNVSALLIPKRKLCKTNRVWQLQHDTIRYILQLKPTLSVMILRLHETISVCRNLRAIVPQNRRLSLCALLVCGGWCR